MSAMRHGTLDENERERVRRQLTSSLVVEAGAGTGKTSLLIDRLMHLLAPGDDLSATTSQFDIGQLVAITFTEKAAAELRDRLRRELESAATKPGTAHWRQYLKALLDFDRAPLSTIHAFAASLIRERPVEAGVDPDFQHLEPDEERDILDDALEEALTAPDRGRDRMLAEFRLHGGGFTDLRKLLEQLYQHRDLIAGISRPGNSDFPRRIAEMQAIVRGLAENARRQCSEPADKARMAMEKLASTIPSRPDEYGVEIWRWLRTAKSLDARHGNKKNWQREHLTGHKEAVSGLKDQAATLLGNLNSELLNRVLEWLKVSVSVVERLKEERGLLNYDDLLLKAAALLTDPDNRSHFHDRYPRILIDEFQDTDPLQVQIALRLCGGLSRSFGSDEELRLEPGGICIVGDPKQSIYRFRRADPRIYRRAAEKILQTGESVTISHNFRSARGIVEFVNDLFTTVWDSFPNDGIPYQPIQADPSRQVILPEPSVKLLTADGNGAALKKVDDIRRAEALALAAIIHTAVEVERWQVLDRRIDGEVLVRPAEYGDVAILMPSMTDVETYTEIFERSRIPCRIDGKRFLYQRQIVTDIVNCMTAIDNPADYFSVIGALRSPLFGIPDYELLTWRSVIGGDLDYRQVSEYAPASVVEACTLLNRLHEHRYNWTPDRILDELMRVTGSWQALTAMSDETDLLLVSRIREQAHIAAAEEGLSWRDFRRRLEARLEAVEREEAAPTPPNAQQVRIMTIHAAKGLEFPIVMLANLHRGRPPSQSVIADRMDEALELRLRDGCQTAGYERAAEFEAGAQAAERVRLLYVALTRARDHLIVPAFRLENPGDIAAVVQRYLEVKHTAGQQSAPSIGADCAYINVTRATTDIAEPEASYPDEEWLTGLRNEIKTWDMERTSRLEAVRRRLPRVMLPSAHEPNLLDAASLTGIGEALALGRALHRYLAECLPGEVFDAQLADYLSRDEGTDPQRVAQLVKSCLTSALWQNAAAAPRMWRETPIAVTQEDGILRGAIDLVWEDTGGRLHITDWKSGRQQAERHAQQLRDYAAALSRATGRTVTGAALFYADDGVTVDIPLMV